MNNRFFTYIILFLACILLQVLVFNHIALFHVAIPVVFIYFLIRLPIDMKLQFVFILAFLIGLIVDIFSDTPGVNALACTLIAGIRKPLYYAYVPKDDVTSRLVPCVAALGITEYIKYLLSFVVIYCFLVFSIEYFSFADVKGIVILSASSAALTFVILLAADCLIPD